MLQIRKWAGLCREASEKIVGLNLNIAEPSESLFRDGSVSLLDERMPLTLTGADEDDFYCLNKLFLFVELIDEWRVWLSFIQTCEGTSYLVG